MSQLNLANVRMVLDAYGHMSRIVPKDGYSACYSITEADYQIKTDNKIGFVGIKDLGVPDITFYQSDLRQLINSSSNPYAGFYEIVEASDFVVGDIVSIDVCADSVKLFDIPLVIIGEDKDTVYLKLVIETFEKPAKKSFMDWITRNPYWDCGKVSKGEFTHKYQKLSVDNVIPNRYLVDSDNAA